MARELAIWANGQHVGVWRIPTRGPMELVYDKAWADSAEARPLSLSLPLNPGRLKGTAVAAYFDNLLPDSDPIRRRLQERFRTPSREPFDLLAEIGRDCVGAVQLLPPGATPESISRIEAEPLGATAVARALSATIAPAGANLPHDDDFRISIAGAQEKSAFLWHKGRWCRPLGATPTTHIFKLPLGVVGNLRADMRTSVENEWLCAQILAAYGIPIATCEMDQFGEHKVLIVERFDRVLHPSGRYWLRLMQEDFCQATGTPSHLKYEADGGPGLREIAALLRGSEQRDRDLACVFKAQLLFWMLAATDGHAKNFSLRILAGGRFQLTPLYDVLSAWPIIGRRANQLAFAKARLAMALHSKRARYRIRDIQRRHFDELARQMGVGTAGETMIAEIVEATPRVIENVQRRVPKTFPAVVLDSVLEGLKGAAQRI